MRARYRRSLPKVQNGVGMITPPQMITNGINISIYVDNTKQ